MYQIELRGLASQKTEFITWDEADHELKNMNLLDFLLSNGRPIAYGCYAKGVCRKCILTINGTEFLSCQIPMKDIANGAIIKIGYL